MHRTDKTAFLTTIGLSALAVAMPAAAQEAAVEGCASDEGAIVVAARKREESLLTA